MTPVVMQTHTGQTRSQAVLVWGVFVIMLGTALAQIVRYAHNVPFAEDWMVVPFAHGTEPLAFDWLWSQNNEHRVPLGRLLLLALFRLTSDYRAGMFFNAAVLAFLSFLMVRTAAALRGHIAYTDAFFPIAFLNWGHAENLGWSWELTFVLSSLFACLLLVLIARQKTERVSPAAAVLTGLCLVALPLTGGTGLVYVPALAAWAAIGAFLGWNHKGRQARRGALLLAGSVVLVLVITALYFVRYQRAYWNPSSPSLLATIRTTGALLALSIGPAARLSWAFFAGAMILFCFVTGSVVVRRFRDRNPGEGRVRLYGMTAYGSALALLALAIGHGRAGLIPRYGMPIRYVLLALPVLCWAYFAWQLYVPARARSVHAALLTVMLVLMPFNHRFGMQWTDYYTQGMNAFENDVRAGAPVFVLCNQYQTFLMHWDGEGLCAGLRTLQQAGVGIFPEIARDPVMTEIPAANSGSNTPRAVYAIRLYLTDAAASRGDWLDVSWGGGHRLIRIDAVKSSHQKSYLIWVNGRVSNLRLQCNKEPAARHVSKVAFLVAGDASAARAAER